MATACEGLGECVADVDPYYSSETNVAAWHVIKDFLAPLVLGRAFEDPRDVFPALARVRGHHMAKAAVEMACWDLAARAAERAAVAAARRHPRRRLPPACRSASRIRSSSCAAKIETELDAGYRRIKIKIKPGWDVAVGGDDPRPVRARSR